MFKLVFFWLLILSTNDRLDAIGFLNSESALAHRKVKKKPTDVVRFLARYVDWSVICILCPPVQEKTWEPLFCPFLFLHCNGLDTPYLFWPKGIYMYILHTHKHTLSHCGINFWLLKTGLKCSTGKNKLLIQKAYYVEQVLKHNNSQELPWSPHQSLWAWSFPRLEKTGLQDS